MTRRPTIHVAGFVSFLVLCGGAMALQDVWHQWGFNGTVVPGRVNIFTVILRNGSAEPFDGDIVLRRPDMGHGQWVRHEYIASYSEKVVQFHVHITNDQSDFLLLWGTEPGERLQIKAAPVGPPAQVLLQEEGSAVLLRTNIRPFPEAAFPVTVSACDGLGRVLLDHVPRWHTPKRTAFRDWVYAGGTVHLLQAPDGQFPVFSKELDMLNTDKESSAFGTGWIVRHRMATAECTPQYLTQQGFPAYQLQQMNNQQYQDADTTVFERLNILTHVEHNWFMIYAVAVLYLWLTGHGMYLVSRKIRDYRLVIGIFLLTVVVFTLFYNYVGRRGYGEETQIHTVSHARMLEDGWFDVSNWSNFFVTQGGVYEVAHPATQNLYNDVPDISARAGTIQCEGSGRYEIEIPLFSSAMFLYRGKLRDEGFQVTTRECITKGDGPGGLQLELQLGPELAKRTQSAWAFYAEKIWALQRQGDQLTVSSSGHHNIADMPDLDIHQAVFNTRAARVSPKNAGDKFNRVYAPLGQFLFRNAMGRGLAWGQQEITPCPLAPAVVYVCIYAERPSSFAPQGTAQEDGYVVYQFTVNQTSDQGK